MGSLLPDSLSAYVTDGMEPFYLQPRQMEFATSEADIVVFGGAAGGGKTRALLYEPISRGLHENPGFTGVVFRETYPEIEETGGPWDESLQIYPWLNARPIKGHHEWHFPSGAKMAFRYIDHEDTKYKYKGSQICYLAFDELTSFSESVFWYMLSRNRSTCGVTPYVRCTTNPDVNWVKTKLLAPWVDREYRGKPATSCEIRWIKRNASGDIEWFDHPVEGSKSLTFIRSLLTDNPALLEKDPTYIHNLEILLPVERERLLGGNWDVRREGLVYPEFERCIRSPCGNPNESRTPEDGGMDFGVRNAFAAVWGHYDHDDVLWITGGRYKRGMSIQTHSANLPLDVEWWCDPAGTDQRICLHEAGHSVRPCVHLPTKGAVGETKHPLLGGIDAVRQRMMTGGLVIVRCPETMDLIRELGIYHYDEKKTETENPVDEDNHAPDALRYLVVGNDRRGKMDPAKPRETPKEREEREAKEKAARLAIREERDLAAQANINDDRWWDT